MSNFDKLIKQKVEQFNAPYNEAHWAEMEGKLNKIRSTKIRNNSLIAVGTIAVIAITSILYFNNSTENNTLIVDSENNIQLEETINTPKNTVLTTKPNTNKVNKNEHTSKSKENNIELKETIETGTSNSEIITPKEIEQKNPETEKIVEEKILPNKIPSAEFIVYNNRTCLGGEVNFESMENDLPISYTWNFGDGTISHKPNPSHTYKESLVYTVSLTLLNRQTGKEYTTIQQDVVTILPQPNASFTYVEESKKHDDNALKYPYTVFNIKNTNKKITYQWVLGNGEISKTSNPKTIYENEGTYLVKLIATNSYGCENSTKKKIIIKNSTSLYAPNAFTPNADGRNDYFIPKALMGRDVQFEMTITDLSNRIVYKTSDKNNPWQGRLNNNGSILPRGIYLWKVITYDADGKAYQHAGKVNLLD